jgi:hypothetical protein
MKFGLLYDFRNPSQPDYFEPWPEFYGGGLEHIEEMERLCFHAVLDILSGRRIDTGFGQVGQTFNMEFPMLGVNPKHRPLLFEGT